MPRAQIQMVGVAEDDLGVEGFQRVLGDGLDGARSAYGHENGSFDGLMGQMKLGSAAAFGDGIELVEGEGHVAILPGRSESTRVIVRREHLQSANRVRRGLAMGESGATDPNIKAALPGSEGLAAHLFVEYEPRLFDLYTRFRYNELVCRRLTREAIRLEKWVRWSVFITLAVSLMSGVLPGMNQAKLNWIWGSLTTAATLLTLYSLAEGSGEKQFRWFQIAMRFHSTANKVEFFSAQVKRGKIREDELEESWNGFTRELELLIDSAGPGFLEYEASHQDELTDELAATLRREHKAV